MNKTTRSHIDDYPEILREQALLGELEPALQAQIETSQGYLDFKAKRLAENAEILRQYPSRENLETIKRKNLSIVARQEPKHRSFAVLIKVAPVAAALLLVLFIVQPFGSRDTQGSGDGTRSKGVNQDNFAISNPGYPKLEIWKRSDSQAIPLQSGALVQAFDKLQIAYHAKGKKYGVIISLDGNGKLTLHYPDSFDASTSLRQGSGIVLPYAYQLDSAPQFERFFFVTSNSEFKVDRIWRLIERQLAGKDVPSVWAMEAALNLDPGFEGSSFLLRK